VGIRGRGRGQRIEIALGKKEHKVGKAVEGRKQEEAGKKYMYYRASPKGFRTCKWWCGNRKFFVCGHRNHQKEGRAPLELHVEGGKDMGENHMAVRWGGGGRRRFFIWIVDETRGTLVFRDSAGRGFNKVNKTGKLIVEHDLSKSRKRRRVGEMTLRGSRGKEKGRAPRLESIRLASI